MTRTPQDTLASVERCRTCAADCTQPSRHYTERQESSTAGYGVLTDLYPEGDPYLGQDWVEDGWGGYSRN